MLQKTIAPLLIGAVMLFTLVPSKAFAQSQSQPQVAESRQALSDAQVKPKPDLKTVFAKEMVSVKDRTLTAADYKRIEKNRQQQEARHATGNGLSKREKVGLIVFAVAMVAIITALLIHGIEDSPSCFDDPGHPDCV